MHTIIKIAVVSVLSLFAIVGLVSISKAEVSVWKCEMTEFYHIRQGDKSYPQELEKFMITVTPYYVSFISNGNFDGWELPMFRYTDYFLWIANYGTAVVSMSGRSLVMAQVVSGEIRAVGANCEEV